MKSARVVFVCAALVCAGAFAQQRPSSGLETTAPATLYDSHSSLSRPLWILSGGHPARKLTSVTGWHKVETADPAATGWLRADETRAANLCVVVSPQAAVKTEPSPSAPDSWAAARDVVLRVLKDPPCGAGGCWLEVAHADGETGYIAKSDVWCNF